MWPVVVHAEEVQRARDRLEITIAHERHVGERPEVLDQIGRIATSEQRIDEERVRVEVHHARGFDVVRVLGGRHDRLQVQRDPDVGPVHRLPSQSVREEQMVGRGKGSRVVGSSRRVDPGPVPQPGRDPWLVQGDPGRDLSGE
jgi:septum formation topological specificity factor MinE